VPTFSFDSLEKKATVTKKRESKKKKLKVMINKGVNAKLELTVFHN